MSNLIQPGWSINAFFYELLQSKLIHSIDGYIIGELSGQGILDKDSVRGVDFGSGTGDLTLKIARDLLQRGRTDARVYSVENDPLMNEKLKTRLRKLESRSHTRGIERLISPIRGNLYGPIIDTIATETQGIDFAIFKRCLYSDK